MILPVLHVGFHKSGSTTLQNALFSRHSDIANLGEPVEESNALAAMTNAWESCSNDPAKRQPFDLEHSRVLWQQGLATVTRGKVPVFSKERLTRFGFCGEPDCLPSKLHAMVGPARIVIMTRHQIKLVESLYYSKTDGEVGLDQWLKSESEGPLNEGRFHLYRYHAFAEAYASVFGRENVGVFMLEELANDTESFTRRLCSFIGIDAEQGVALLQKQRFHSRKTNLGLAYAKLRKLIGPGIHFGKYVPANFVETFTTVLGRGRPVRVELPARWVAELKSCYREDNRRLSQDWDLPLEKYEYPL